MSDELDRRAALAMVWTWIQHTSETFDESDGHWTAQNGHMERYFFSPSTDRNDLSELLREVERRGLGDNLARKMRVLWMEEGRAVIAWPINDYTFWLMVLDPAVICEAACEVLEAANERN